MRLTRVRFTLRNLMVLVLVFGGGFGWVVHRAHVQRDAVLAITRAGGSVQYDSGWSPSAPPAGALASQSPWWPNRLVDDVGTDFMSNVVKVYFTRVVADAELIHLASLTRLESLVFPPSTLLTDAGLVHLRGLTSLTSLQIPRSKVGREGLVNMEGMTNLETLILGGSEVTDTGLVHLKGLTNLRTLDLSNTKVTDAGMTHLKGLNNLEGLSLAGTQVSDVGLADLKGLAKLKTLLLAGTNVSDAGVRELQKAMPQVKVVR